MSMMGNPTLHQNRHEWVCGPPTSERSDWRRHEYPEMAVDEGESKPALTTMQLRNRHERVCGLTTSERSDWRKHAYPEMAVNEGELKTHAHNQSPQKPARSGVRADDIGAQRLEETRIPRDGG